MRRLSDFSRFVPLLCVAALGLLGPLFSPYVSDFVVKVMILSIFALSLELLVGFVDTFGKLLFAELSGMGVYVLMAIVLIWRPEGLMGRRS